MMMKTNFIKHLLPFLLIAALFFVQCKQDKTKSVRQGKTEQAQQPKTTGNLQGEDVVKKARKPRTTTTLEHLVRPANIDNAPSLILLHGYRSNEESFFQIAKSIPENYTVISVRAPKKKGPKAYAWYDLDWANNKAYETVEFEYARQTIVDFIEFASNKYGLNKSQVHLCGFSQGAILSYAVGLTRPDLVRGIAPLSGRIVKETKANMVDGHKLKSLKVFVAHGDKDQVISVEESRTAVPFLKELGVNTTYVEEPNLGHSSNQNILTKLIEWLQ